MAKRLCKLRRHDIAESLGEITSLVSESKYMCRSCARSSSEKSSLCKPLALSHQPEPSVVPEVQAEVTDGVMLSKKVLKKAKKEAKKQEKYQKKLKKVLKKQKKMVKKHQELEKEFSSINMTLLSLNDSLSAQAIH
ncbi:hypothetical protein [Vibrio sp. HN007]|uniref:hypothetical protein n=1 Tax=Vibrio iocasae TaxID=3098914 RepID=UPI0035D45B3A